MFVKWRAATEHQKKKNARHAGEIIKADTPVSVRDHVTVPRLPGPRFFSE